MYIKWNPKREASQKRKHQKTVREMFFKDGDMTIEDVVRMVRDESIRYCANISPDCEKNILYLLNENI